MSAEKTSYNIGSRKSKLAMIQTREVMAKLQSLNPSYSFQIHEQETLGDKVLDVALSKIGDKGLFTQELEDGLRSSAIDFAVHSLKDLPTRLPEGLVIGCILERVNPIDVVLMRSDLAAKGVHTLDQLNKDAAAHSTAATIGTSSLRRQSQLQALYPNLKCIDIRGNLDTRIKKLENRDFSQGAPDYSAIILASAGLERQGADYTSRITQQLSEEQMYYAVGQGALAVECRANDQETLALLSKLHHHPTALQCLAERSFLRMLEGGCHAPIGVSTSISSDGKTLQLKGRVLSLDGSTCVQVEISGAASDAEQLGEQLAQKALAQGADTILAFLAKK
jgi:hydroxymethylbilane synthase